MIIMPSSRKTTFQSIEVSSWKNAEVAFTPPTRTMAAAPPSAAYVRGMRSEAMSA